MCCVRVVLYGRNGFNNLPPCVTFSHTLTVGMTMCLTLINKMIAKVTETDLKSTGLVGLPSLTALETPVTRASLFDMR
jgi:hypothetical protein